MRNLTQLQAILSMGLSFILVIGILGLIGKRMKWETEFTRKLMHIMVGLICILMPYKFTNHWYVFFSTVSFTLLLLAAKKFNKIPAFNKIGRVSYGVILFPLAIYLNYLLYLHYAFQPVTLLPLLVLTFSDPMAFFAGKLFKQEKKSLPGSTAFFVTALVAGWVFLSIFHFGPLPHKVILLFAVAIFSTFIEAISGKGWDNLTIPLSIIGILIVYLETII